MTDSHYHKFDGAELILRDELAIDRTLLANERTLLAYLRSAVALVIAGVSIINFARDSWFMMVGFVCIPAGILAGIVGWVRYAKMNRSIALIRRQANIQGLDAPLPDSTEKGT